MLEITVAVHEAAHDGEVLQLGSLRIVNTGDPFALPSRGAYLWVLEGSDGRITAEGAVEDFDRGLGAWALASLVLQQVVRDLHRLTGAPDPDGGTTPLQQLHAHVAALEADPDYIAERLSMAFSEEVLRLANARGWNRTELARQVGITKQAVSRWLGGLPTMTLRQICTLALPLGVQPHLTLRARVAEQGGDPGGVEARPR